MNILYFGSACDKEWFTLISNRRKLPSLVAQYKFETAMLEGFSNINDINMKIYYLYQEAYYPKGEIFFRRKKAKINKKYIINYISIINLPMLKEIIFFLKGFLKTLFWGIKNRREKEKVILTAFNYTPLSVGIFLAAKLFSINRINIFTDLSSDIINDQRQKDMIWFKRLILPIYLNLVEKVESSYDMYILFTEAMNSRVNPNNKPYLIIEGIYNSQLDMKYKKKERALMYAGTLAQEYGIKVILDTFEQIQDEKLELWIFGDGDMKTYIEKLCNENKTIKYFGFLPHDEVFDYEKRATLLVNFRDPQDKYTSYSFPSKTFEYMVSGTPFLTTKLKGIPDEYYNYLFTVDKYSIDNLKDKIIEILNMNSDELDLVGFKARNFIIETKNSLVQATKIIKKIQNDLIK